MIKDANNKLKMIDVQFSIIIVLLDILLLVGIGLLLGGALGAINIIY